MKKSLVVICAVLFSGTFINAQVELESEFAIEDNKVEIQIKRKEEDEEADIENELELEFELEGKSSGFKSTFEFESESENGEIEKSVKNDIRFNILEVIEFVDTGEAGYQDEDVVSRYPSDGTWEWKNVVETTDGDKRIFTFTTTDDIFSAIATYTTVEDGNLSPDQLKLDFKIDNFPFAEASGSTLAFHTSAKSKNKIKSKEEGFETQVDKSVTQGALTWITTVDVDGETEQIIESVGDDSGDGPEVYFTIEDASSASEILWDPTLGLISTSSTSNIALIAGLASAGAVLVLLGAFFVWRKKSSASSENSGQIKAAEPV